MLQWRAVESTSETHMMLEMQPTLTEYILRPRQYSKHFINRLIHLTVTIIPF